MIRPSLSTHKLYLYGGDRPWDPDCWVASDDRVRGGASQSFIRRHDDDDRVVLFYGHLDIITLGGAGFASQRTREALDLDLSDYQGLTVSVARGDRMRYTLILKDEIVPRRDDGREQSSLSWEFDFEPGEGGEINACWEQFRPTYRGRLKPDSRPLNVKSIKRVAIMVRSFFGDQEGDFELCLRHIATLPYPSSSGTDYESSLDEKVNANTSAQTSTWFRWFGCGHR